MSNSGDSRFTLHGLRQLHDQLVHHKLVINDGNSGIVVEALRVIAEMVVYGDNKSELLFDFFCEKNMLALFLEIMWVEGGCPAKVHIQILQTLSILVNCVRNDTSLYYLLSNNYINEIIIYPHDFSLDESLCDQYVSFIKSLSLRLDKQTIQFFFQEETGSFPLLNRAIDLLNFPDPMVRISAQSTILNIYSVNETRARQYALQDEVMHRLFSQIVVLMESKFNTILVICREYAKVVRLLGQDGPHRSSDSRRSEDATSPITGNKELSRLEAQLQNHLTSTEDWLLYLHDLLGLGIMVLRRALVSHLLTEWIYPSLLSSFLRRHSGSMLYGGKGAVSNQLDGVLSNGTPDGSTSPAEHLPPPPSPSSTKKWSPTLPPSFEHDLEEEDEDEAILSLVASLLMLTQVLSSITDSMVYRAIVTALLHPLSRRGRKAALELAWKRAMVGGVISHVATDSSATADGLHDDEECDPSQQSASLAIAVDMEGERNPYRDALCHILSGKQGNHRLELLAAGLMTVILHRGSTADDRIPDRPTSELHHVWLYRSLGVWPMVPNHIHTIRTLGIWPVDKSHTQSIPSFLAVIASSTLATCPTRSDDTSETEPPTLSSTLATCPTRSDDTSETEPPTLDMGMHAGCSKSNVVSDLGSEPSPAREFHAPLSQPPLEASMADGDGHDGIVRGEGHQRVLSNGQEASPSSSSQPSASSSSESTSTAPTVITRPRLRTESMEREHRAAKGLNEGLSLEPDDLDSPLERVDEGAFIVEPDIMDMSRLGAVLRAMISAETDRASEPGATEGNLSSPKILNPLTSIILEALSRTHSMSLMAMQMLCCSVYSAGVVASCGKKATGPGGWQTDTMAELRLVVQSVSKTLQKCAYDLCIRSSEKSDIAAQIPYTLQEELRRVQGRKWALSKHTILSNVLLYFPPAPESSLVLGMDYDVPICQNEVIRREIQVYLLLRALHGALSALCHMKESDAIEDDLIASMRLSSPHAADLYVFSEQGIKELITKRAVSSGGLVVSQGDSFDMKGKKFLDARVLFDEKTPQKLASDAGKGLNKRRTSGGGLLSTDRSSTPTADPPFSMTSYLFGRRTSSPAVTPSKTNRLGNVFFIQHSDMLVLVGPVGPTQEKLSSAADTLSISLTGPSTSRLREASGTVTTALNEKFEVCIAVPLVNTETVPDPSDKRRLRIIVRSWDPVPNMDPVTGGGPGLGLENEDQHDGIRASPRYSLLAPRPLSTLWQLELQFDTDQACLLAREHIEARMTALREELQRLFVGLLKQAI